MARDTNKRGLPIADRSPPESADQADRYDERYEEQDDAHGVRLSGIELDKALVVYVKQGCGGRPVGTAVGEHVDLGERLQPCERGYHQDEDGAASQQGPPDVAEPPPGPRAVNAGRLQDVERQRL